MRTTTLVDADQGRGRGVPDHRQQRRGARVPGAHANGRSTASGSPPSASCRPARSQVDIKQPLARLAFYLIEPRSDDGLVDWNILDDGARAKASRCFRSCGRGTERISRFRGPPTSRPTRQDQPSAALELPDLGEPVLRHGTQGAQDRRRPRPPGSSGASEPRIGDARRSASARAAPASTRRRTAARRSPSRRRARPCVKMSDRTSTVPPVSSSGAT